MNLLAPARPPINRPEENSEALQWHALIPVTPFDPSLTRISNVN